MNESIQNLNDPLALARQALAERCRNNPRYSLRAFARQTGISHTVLSLTLSGKRRFSRGAARKLCDFLDLDPEQTERVVEGRRKAETSYDALDLDAFQLISDWYHYAILSALELPGAKYDAAWLARALSISPAQAKLAMGRLERLGLVEQKHGRWRQTGKSIVVDNAHSTTATRAFHRQLLEKAKESIETTAFEHRDMSSTTFAMSASQIPYAKKRIREFRRQLAAELEAAATPDAVYNLTVQIFPVTPVETK